MTDIFPPRQLTNSASGMLEWLTGKGYPDASCQASNVSRNNYARALARLRFANAKVLALYEQRNVESCISELTEEYRKISEKCAAAVLNRDKAYQEWIDAESALTPTDIRDAENIIEKVSKYENWRG